MPQLTRLLGTAPGREVPKDLSANQQKLIEEAYGQGPLDELVWAKIDVANFLYASFAPIESGVSMDEFLGRLDRLRAAACDVMECLPEMGYRTQEAIDPNITGFQRLLAIANKYFSIDTLEWTPVRPWSAYELLLHTLDSVEAVVPFAKNEIRDDDAGYFRGAVWDNWIRWLTIILNEHDLPYGAAKDAATRDKMSSFVLFVQELQRHVKTDAQRPFQSLDALSQAIYRARKGMKENRKFLDLVNTYAENSDGDPFGIMLEDTVIPVNKAAIISKITNIVWMTVRRSYPAFCEDRGRSARVSSRLKSRD
jgi:hypothetical protein